MKKTKFKLALFFLSIFTVVLLFWLLLYDTIVESNNFLLIAIFFIVIYFLALIPLFYVFREVDKKNNDIQSAKSMFYNSNTFVIKIKQNGDILFTNDQFLNIIYEANLYKNIKEFETNLQEEDLLEEIRKKNSFILNLKNNENKIINIKFIPLNQGKNYLLIGEDITKDHEENNLYRNLALHNTITKFPNKNYLRLDVEKVINSPESMRNKNSILVLDIEGFKNVNRLFGYKIGDELLKLIAKKIDESLDDYEAKIYNIELDNFAILFTNLEKYGQVNAWASDFIDTFKEAVDVNGNLISISFKIGVYNFETVKSKELTFDDVIENTLLALRRAKENRRASIIVYDISLGKHFTREQLMEVDLASAIRKKELIIYLQPILNNKVNKIVGFESLVRWNNPLYMYDSPSLFIDIAERNNLIVDIGRFIIDESLRVAKMLEHKQMQIAINISPVQIVQSGFVHDLFSAIEKYNIRKDLISIDITESFLVNTQGVLIEKLTLIKKSGIKIYIDNFGTGSSSFFHLKELPITGVSINREFIKDVKTDESARNIVEKIVSLAKSLGLEVIAEGVEEERQNAFLKQIGCNVVQGYLISKPLPIEEAIEFSNKYNGNSF